MLASASRHFRTVALPDSTTALRAEVRAFLQEEVAKGTFGPGCDVGMGAHSPEFSRKLGAREWIGVTWPRRYGGGERSALDRYVITEELLAFGAPVAAHWVADRQSGPLLLRYGTEDQRSFFLPIIARGECYFAIGMSEPDSGSDLASVRTIARRVEGGWVISGRKVWTSHADHSHYMITLCRTSPVDPSDRHAGLSQLIIDLKLPGVEIRPITLLNGQRHFAEVLLDEVFVPDAMLVGNVGSGWEQVTSELALERSGPERFFSTFQLLVALVDEVQQTRRGELALGELVARFAAVRRLSISVAAALQAGQAPLVEAALVKDVGTRLEHEITEVARKLVAAEPDLDSGRPFEALLAQAVLSGPGYTIRGGTSEILRGIVAQGLGLR